MMATKAGGMHPPEMLSCFVTRYSPDSHGNLKEMDDVNVWTFGTEAI